MGKQVARTRNGGTMTEAQYHSKIMGALRKAFAWWKPMQDAKKLCRRPSQSSNKRLKFEYQCAACQNWFPEAETRIDHIVSCGTLRHVDDVAQYIKNLTSEDPAGYQILCTCCHQIKTNAENDARREFRKIRSSE